MGRRKIEIQPITHERNRSVTFLKRKNGLFKKAYELGVLCSIDVAVIIFEERPGHNVKLHEYCSTDVDSMVQKRFHFDGERDTRIPADFNNKHDADIGGDDEEDGDDEEQIIGGTSANQSASKRKESNKPSPGGVNRNLKPSGSNGNLHPQQQQPVKMMQMKASNMNPHDGTGIDMSAMNISGFPMALAMNLGMSGAGMDADYARHLAALTANPNFPHMHLPHNLPQSSSFSAGLPASYPPSNHPVSLERHIAPSPHPHITIPVAPQLHQHAHKRARLDDAHHHHQGFSPDIGYSASPTSHAPMFGSSHHTSGLAMNTSHLQPHGRPGSPTSEVSYSSSAWGGHTPPPPSTSASALAASFAQALYPSNNALVALLAGAGGRGSNGSSGFDWPVHQSSQSGQEQSQQQQPGGSNSESSSRRPSRRSSTRSTNQLLTPPIGHTEPSSASASTPMSAHHDSPPSREDQDTNPNEPSWLDFLSAAPPSTDNTSLTLDLTSSPPTMTSTLSPLSTSKKRSRVSDWEGDGGGGGSGSSKPVVKEDPEVAMNANSRSLGAGRSPPVAAP